MTTITLFKALIEILAVILVCYGIYHEKKLIRFERKAFKFVKCFFKACVLTIEEKRAKNKSSAQITDISAFETEASGSAKKDSFRIA